VPISIYESRSWSYAFQEAGRIAPKFISRFIKRKEFFGALTNRPIGGTLTQAAVLFKFPKLAIVLMAALDATVLLVPAAAAANYTFTKIADNSPGSNLLIPGSSSSIALNASGAVAFSARRADSKGNPTSNLVLTGSGGALTIIEDSGSNLRFAYPYSINSSGAVLFGVTDSGKLTLYTGNGTGMSPVSTDPNDQLIGTATATMNDAGVIAYTALNGAVTGTIPIRIVSNGNIRAVDPDNNHSNFGIGQLDGPGNLVFVGATPSDSAPFLAIDKGGTVTTLATENSQLSLVLSYFPALNDSGVVALTGHVGSETGPAAIVKVAGTKITTVVSGTGSYTPANINNSGTVVYGIQGIGGLGNLTGIFAGPDPAADKVVAIGDDLFGSKVTRLFGLGYGAGRWLNDRGQVAFYYALANGTVGVAVATPAVASPTAPVLPADAVLNAATFAGSAISPGSVVSLFGDSFSANLVVAPSGVLPESLNNVSVTFNGVAAPLYFVSPQQINAQVPFEITGSTAQIQVHTPGGDSDIRTVSMDLFSPGIYTQTQSGSGQGIVTFADTATLAAPLSGTSNGHPARAGDILTIYANGLGPVTPSIASGLNSCGGTCLSDFSNLTLRNVTTAPVVEIGGVSVPAENILFAGLAPLYIGLYQTNLRLPNGIAPGSAVPIILHQGNDSSRSTVTIAVQ
jgi:uncharacterized protein (TIGR03437 family)